MLLTEASAVLKLFYSASTAAGAPCTALLLAAKAIADSIVIARAPWSCMKSHNLQ